MNKEIVLLSDFRLWQNLPFTKALKRALEYEDKNNRTSFFDSTSPQLDDQVIGKALAKMKGISEAYHEFINLIETLDPELTIFDDYLDWDGKESEALQKKLEPKETDDRVDSEIIEME